MFNAGVFLADLRWWGEEANAAMERYLTHDWRCDFQLFHLTNECTLNFVFQELSPYRARLDVSGFGNRRLVGKLLHLLADPKKAKVLHWSGAFLKPWSSEAAPFADVWTRYLPERLVEMGRWRESRSVDAG